MLKSAKNIVNLNYCKSNPWHSSERKHKYAWDILENWNLVLLVQQNDWYRNVCFLQFQIDLVNTQYTQTDIFPHITVLIGQS